MSDLPKGWTVCDLEKNVDILDNLRVPVNSDERQKRLGNVPYFGATGQVGWIDDYLFDEELVLIGEDGAPFFDKSKPISYIVKGKSWVNNHAHVLRADKNITSNLFLKFFLDQFDFNGFVNGTTRLKLNQGALKKIPLKLPPLNEQKRIVEKLEKLLGKVEAVQARLDKIPDILKRFRQAVSNVICSGQLSRERNKVFNNFTIRDITRKLITGPFGSALHKSDYIYGGIPVINPMSMVDGKIIPSEKMSIDEETKFRLSKYLIKKGEIVIARRGELGRCAEVTEKEVGWLCGTGSALLSLKENALPTFVQMIISSPISRAYLSEKSVGTTMENLNQKLFLEMPIYLPPLEEQKEIVRRVEDLFKFADQIEARYKKARNYTNKLTQSILAKAFRGELVPQDETDEPASVLLERIRQEKSDTAGKNHKPKRKAVNQSNLFE